MVVLGEICQCEEEVAIGAKLFFTKDATKKVPIENTTNATKLNCTTFLHVINVSLIPMLG
jgi:hypothetical protein